MRNAPLLIFGKAKPIHPTSSRMPARMPNKNPRGKKLGVYSLDTICDSIRKAIKMQTGAIKTGRSHFAESFEGLSLLLILFRDFLPPVTYLMISPDKNGPSNIRGNIRIPSILGMVSLCIILPATNAKAPDQEIKKVRMK